MLEKSCNEFISDLSSKQPVPGGGGASAFVGALGMALGSMVGNLTLGKKKYQDVEEDIRILLSQSEIITSKLKELVAKDAEVFYPLSQAYGLPQSTDYERQIKELTLQKALVPAAAVPLDIARLCLEAIDLHEEYARKGARIAISDVGVGAAFCLAALLGAKLNVLINTRLMKDHQLRDQIETELQKLVSDGSRKTAEIMYLVEKALA